MKPTYQGFEAKKNGGYLELPPVGAYVAKITAVRVLKPGEENVRRETIEVMLEIAEGDYKGRYTEVWNSQKERFDKPQYKGRFRLVPPVDGDEDWRKRAFEGNLWCVEQSNPNYTWDWDEKKLTGKLVGISVRRYLYTYNDKDRETTEIGKFETVDDVRNGKCKPMKDRDNRTVGSSNSTDGSGFTEVSAEVQVPW